MSSGYSPGHSVSKQELYIAAAGANGANYC